MKKFINIPDIVKDVAKVLKGNGNKAFVVGGFVRDSILNLESKDIDIATDLIVDDVISLFSNVSFIRDVKKTGDKFPVARIFTTGDEEFEIATFRTEKGNGKETVFETCSSIEEDVNRRDFTINALFVDAETGEVFDVVGGLDDLENKIIRFVGNAKDRIIEDRTRLLRLARFAARFNFKVEVDIDLDFSLRKGLAESDKVKKEMMIVEFEKGIKTNSIEFVKNLHKFNILDQMFPNMTYIMPLVNLDITELMLVSMLILNSDEEIEDCLRDMRWSKLTIDRVIVMKKLFVLSDKEDFFLNDISRFIKKIKSCKFDEILDSDMIGFLFGTSRQKFIINFLKFELSVKATDFPLLKGKELGEAIRIKENDLLQKSL